MKKLYIAHIESGLNWGGQELRVIEQIEWLLANNYKSIIIARPNSKILLEAKKRKLPYFELEIRGSANLVQIMKLMKFLKENKVDILDAHSNRDSSYAMFIKFFTKVKVVRSRHVTDKIKNDFFHSLIWKYGSHSIITTAHKIKKDIVSLKLFDENKIFVAPAGVDEKKFNPTLNSNYLKKELDIPQEHIVISNIGMIRGDKGQYYYFKMCELLAEKYKNITFLQIGEATRDSMSYKNKIMRELEISKYKTRIKFIGYKDDIENYISITDIVVIASVGTEAQTRLVSQSFLMKKNVVATNIGGLPEMIIDGESGLLCNSMDEQSLADKVELLLSNASIKNYLQKNAYKYAQEHYTFEKMMNQMLKIYNGIL